MQCCHHQPAIDKVIPIIFKSEDGSIQPSQIFISDKAQRTCNRPKLASVTRKKINCFSKHPYIAILVDLGLPKSAFNVDWVCTKREGVCSLRIYAAGINSNVFPFLKDHPDIAMILRYIACPPTLPPAIQDLQAKMTYGSTSMRRHMCWEITDNSEDSNMQGNTAMKRKRGPTPQAGKGKGKGRRQEK